MAITSIENNQIINNLKALDKTEFSQKRFFILLPIALFLVFTLSIALPFTRSSVKWIIAENHPVEILTFLFLMLGAGFGFKLAFDLYKQGEGIWIIGFYVLFSIGLLLTGLEEIAWGQQFWGFATPNSLKELNMQGETTLHNIQGFHGKTELFRLLFGVGGLIGIWLGKFSKFRKISAPVILLSWFVIITAHATIDVFDDIFTIHKNIDATISWLAELIELFISVAAFFYLYFNSKILLRSDNAKTGLL